MRQEIRRKKVIFYNRITNWLKGDRPTRHVVLVLSLVVGVCTGLAAFVLKFLVEEIKTIFVGA